MSVTSWIRQLSVSAAVELPGSVFRYVLATSAPHQLLLVALTASVFLLEIVPLELQRRIVNDLVKDRPYQWVITLCAVYAGVVLVQGGTKLVLNVYRAWVGERAIRGLRHRIHSVIEAPPTSSPAAELVAGTQGIAEGGPASLAGKTVNKFRPGGIMIVRAGGGAGMFSGIIGGWSAGSPRGSLPVTKEVRN